MKPAINLYLATSTGCNVHCKSCPAGRREPEPGGIMSLDMMKRILDKAQAECRVIGVQLYHYNEPTLIPHMADMIRECRARGLFTFLSSNFVVWKNIPAIMEAGPDVFLISVSGWTQEVYERSHKDGDIEQVKRNMIAANAFRQPNTTMQVSWHDYPYNQHEKQLMADFATHLGYQFVPYATSLIPHDRAMKEWATGIKDIGGEDLIIPVKDAKKLCYERRWFTCILQDQIIAINGKGDLLLCSNFADNANLRGNLFETTIPEFLTRRKKDPVCKACKAVGGHVYALQAYTRSNWSPLVWGEQVYRRLGLQGRWPKLSAWASRSLYRVSRPQEKGGL